MPRLPRFGFAPRRRLAVALGLFGLLNPAGASAGAARPATPAEAIQWAAAAAPQGVTGVFEMTVRAVGRANGNTYLNSEPDYRDPRCLTIEIVPSAVDDFRAKYGHEPFDLLKGRLIRVRGEVRRVTIFLAVNGQKTDRFYYQTHVQVSDAGQIELSPGTRVPPRQTEIDASVATFDDVRRVLPGRPALAAYQLRLERRIDELFFEELRARHFAGGGATGAGHGIRLIVTVMADGRVGADDKEIKLRLTQEPLFAEAALRSLARITEAPEPFPPELKKEVGDSFSYSAHFVAR